MKKLSALFSITITFIFISCVSRQQLAQQVWYTERDFAWHYIHPQMVKTSEEAISAIKLHQSNVFMNFYEGVVDLQVDKYGLIIKSSRETQNTQYKVEPITTSGFANNKLSSYYSNTTYVGKNVTTKNTNIISTSLIFKNIDSITLVKYPTLYNGAWGIDFCNGEKILMSVYPKDKDTAIDLINAVFTLASKIGATIKTKELGVFTTPITPQQAITLGIIEQKGIVITEIFKDSPAEKYGFMINDIITHVDGDIVSTNADYERNIYKKEKNKFKLTLIRMTDFNVGKNVYNYETLDKVVSFN